MKTAKATSTTFSQHYNLDKQKNTKHLKSLKEYMDQLSFVAENTLTPSVLTLQAAFLTSDFS